MSEASWLPEPYLAFEEDRTRPVRDLLAAVPTRPVRTAIDLGCGPGNSTAMLCDAFPEAAIAGLDSATAMLEAARKRLPDVVFEEGDIASWNPPLLFDVILSNAALQWVPDHASLLPRLVARLTPGGALAVQMPDNLSEPSQTLMQAVAADGPWADRLARAATARTLIAGPEDTYALLKPLCRAVTIWRTTYHAVLADGAAGIVAWFRSTGLLPFLDPLDETERRNFLARYQQEVGCAHRTMPDGAVLLPMPRLFIVAQR